VYLERFEHGKKNSGIGSQDVLRNPHTGAVVARIV
jgi:hypothetical protein